jgi:hypothetical protein
MIMRIHGDILDSVDLAAAAVAAGVTIQRQSEHGSRSRIHAYDVILSGSSPYWANSGGYGADGFKAATWDEWGWFLAYLFEVDPRLTVPHVYADAAGFHRSTHGEFRGTRNV